MYEVISIHWMYREKEKQVANPETSWKGSPQTSGLRETRKNPNQRAQNM